MKRWALIERAIWLALGIALAAGVGVFAFRAVLALQASLSLDYTEGPLLNQARLLLAGRPLYRADLTDYPYTVTNYPPLYPMAVALVGRLLGFSYATGRIVSVLASFGCGLALFLIVLRLTGDRAAAAVAVGLFLSFPFVVYWGSLGRVDMMALAFSLWGIWAAVLRPDSWKGLGLSLLLLIAAIYTRQSYLLAAPLAVILGLAVRDRRRALLFAAGLAAAVLSLFGLLQWRTGGGFYFHTVVANANPLLIRRAVESMVFTLYRAAPLIVVLLPEVLCFARRRESPLWLPVGYLVGGSLSALTIGKAGSNVNYFLEWVAAASIVVGVGIARWRREMPVNIRLMPLSLLVLQAIWAAYTSYGYIRDIQMHWTLEPEVRRLENMVCTAPGPVLASEMLSVIVVCGRELLLQPLEYTLLATEGKWDQRPLVADIKAGKFSLILIEKEQDRWTPEMWAAIQERYEPETVLAGITVYRPRGPSP